jgi:hypothetical protein
MIHGHPIFDRGRRGHDRMVVGLTAYVISVQYHWCCEFESRSGRGVQHYVIKFVSDLRQVKWNISGPHCQFQGIEEFEDTKGVIRIRISKKNRQHNGKKKKDKQWSKNKTLSKNLKIE